MNHERKLFLVVLVWGVNYLILPYGVSWFGTGAFTFLRFALTMPALFLLLWKRDDLAIDVNDIPILCCIGLIGTTGYQATFAAAVHLTSTANAAVLFSLSPVFSMILNKVAGRDNPRLSNWFGVLLAFVGGVVLVLGSGRELTFGANQITGDMLMLVAALLWALSTFVSERVLKKYGGLKVTAWSLPAGILGLLLFSTAELATVSFDAVPASAWWSLTFAVVGATVIGVVLFYSAIPHLGARKVMTYMYLVPVIAILLSSVVFETELSTQQIAGIGMSLLGVFLARSRPSFKNNHQTIERQLTGKLTVPGERSV